MVGPVSVTWPEKGIRRHMFTAKVINRHYSFVNGKQINHCHIPGEAKLM